MKVLLDEDLDHRLRKSLSLHQVCTVQYLGWAGLKNGALLRASRGRIDAFLTMDTNLEHQQHTGECDASRVR